MSVAEQAFTDVTSFEALRLDFPNLVETPPEFTPAVPQSTIRPVQERHLASQASAPAAEQDPDRAPLVHSVISAVIGNRVVRRNATALVGVATTFALAACGNGRAELKPNLGPACHGDYKAREYCPQSPSPTPFPDRPVTNESDRRIPGFRVTRNAWPDRFPDAPKTRSANRTTKQCEDGNSPDNSNPAFNKDGAKAIDTKGDVIYAAIDLSCTPDGSKVTGLYPNPDTSEPPIASISLGHGDVVAVTCPVEDGKRVVTKGDKRTTIWVGVNADDGTPAGMPGFVSWDKIGFTPLSVPVKSGKRVTTKAQRSCS